MVKKDSKSSANIIRKIRDTEETKTLRSCPVRRETFRQQGELSPSFTEGGGKMNRGRDRSRESKEPSKGYPSERKEGIRIIQTSSFLKIEKRTDGKEGE